MILDQFRCDGKVAIVTGAGRGVGAGAAIALAQVGATVVGAARTLDQVEATVATITAEGGTATAVRCDVNERADLEALVATTLDEHGRIDILVNNAGGWPPRDFLHTSERAFDEAFHFNVTTAFLLTRLCVPHLAERGEGSVINISSKAGAIVQPGFVAYGTAKAALSFMTRQAAAELAPKIRVNALALGSIATSALDTVVSDESLKATFEANTPMGRIGEVDDVSAAVVYLASPASSYVTGEVLAVSGGIEHPQFKFPAAEL